MQRSFRRHAENATVEPAPRADLASWVLTAAALVLILHLHLLTAFFAGLLVFELVHIIAPALQRHVADRRSRMVAVGLLATIIVGLFAGAIFGIAAFARSDVGNVSALLNKMAEIVEGARSVLPAWMVASLPDTVDEVRDAISQALRDHAGELRLA